MTAAFTDDRVLSARPAPMPANVVPLFPSLPTEATDPAWQLPAPREVPMRLRIDRGRPNFNRWTRHLRKLPPGEGCARD